jgi:cellulose synthase/poly-beta-1,6-N-acetylglucosamine synthase-like glycosyltransferase
MSIELLRRLLADLDYIILFYFILLNSFYTILLICSVFEVASRNRETELEKLEFNFTEAMIPISILSPAYNEAATIVTSVRAMLDLQYPDHEVIVINDGSKDNTLEKLIDSFKLFPVPTTTRQLIKTKQIVKTYRSLLEPKLTVIDKINGGKADSLNTGINACQNPLFLACDADTIIDKHALSTLAVTFLTKSNTVAAGGTIRVVNDCHVENGRVTSVIFPREPLPAIQAVEYLRAFYLGRLGWNRLGGNLVISGAFGLFDRDAALEVGGYATDTVSEDMELIVRMQRIAYEKGAVRSVQFAPGPLAWTEVPSTKTILSRQRERWHRGLIQTLWKHRKMILNPKYGVTGLLGMPYFTFGEMLAPVIEAIGVMGVILGFALDAVDIIFVINFFLVAWGFSIVMNLAAITIEQGMFQKYKGIDDLGRAIYYAFAENLGHRQITLHWRLNAFLKFIRGNNTWGVMERKGFSKKLSSEKGPSASGQNAI